jgi:hypothetical protein
MFTWQNDSLAYNANMARREDYFATGAFHTNGWSAYLAEDVLMASLPEQYRRYSV